MTFVTETTKPVSILGAVLSAFPGQICVTDDAGNLIFSSIADRPGIWREWETRSGDLSITWAIRDV